nr:MAG TPA: Protein of unknown function (DUF1043) [Bacteriophage sp.]
MIEFTAVETLIMTYAPMVATIIGIIIAFLKMIAVLRELRNDTKKSDEEKTAEIKELREQMNGLMKDNAQLRAQLSELLSLLDHKRR